MKSAFPTNSPDSSSPRSPSILFFIPCGRYVLSGVFRALDYIPILEKDGFRCKAVSYSSPRQYYHTYIKERPKSFWSRMVRSVHFGGLYRLFKLLYVLSVAKRFDIIFLGKMALPKWWVRLLASVHTRIIFDIDDAVFLTDPERTNQLIKFATVISAGSQFNLEHVRTINKNAVLLPTPVPTHLYPETPRQGERSDGYINIGWVGTLPNIKYLDLLHEPLRILAEKKLTNPVRLILIGHISFLEDLKSAFSPLEVWLRPYVDPQNLSASLAEFDIGVMPLFNGEFEKGKCASKALVYMAARIPVICSRVGENKRIIQDGVNGYLASNTEEWVSKLTELVENPELRKKMGALGRKTVDEKYSTQVCYKILKHEVLIPLLGPDAP